MTHSKAVAIDLFGTLVRIDPTCYPTLEWEGQVRLSSAALVFERIRPFVPGVDRDRYVAASITVQDELEIERRIEHREIPSCVRFERTLRRAGVDPQQEEGRLLRDVLRFHHDTLLAAARPVEQATAILARLAASGPVVLVSNFDDGPACRRLLDARGFTEHLSSILISEEVGWRKPHPAIFQRAIDEAQCAPEEMLFIGDSPTDDVEGARAVGLIPVWIRGDASPPEAWEPPRWVIDELTGLFEPGGPLSPGSNRG